MPLPPSKVVLADEPTAPDTGQPSGPRVFHHVSETYGVTVVIVTHDRVWPMQLTDLSRFVMARPVRNGAPQTIGRGEEVSKDETSMMNIVLDSAGRLQIPPEYREALGTGDRLTVGIEDGKIVLAPPDASSANAKDSSSKEP